MGKVALITGASQGIGAGIAKVLGGKGMHCVLVARRKEKLEEVKQEIAKAGGSASVYVCDTTDKNQVTDVANRVKSEVGVPDVLVNCAGVVALGHVVQADYDAWDKMVDVNIRSHLYVLGALLPGMKQRGTGHVVNITSVVEKEYRPCIAVYCGTKHFWAGMSKALRLELVGTEVKVTNIQPGAVDPGRVTDSMSEFAKMHNMDPAQMTKKKEKMLLAEDVGEVVWETVSKPGRCYQVEVQVNDMLFYDTEFLTQIGGPK